MRPDLFTNTINMLRFGQTAEDLSARLTNCVTRACETGKQSEITLKIKIKPDANGRQVFITDTINHKLPEFPREQTILFPTDEGNLQRNDPKQIEIDSMKSVPNEQPTEFKQAGENK